MTAKSDLLIEELVSACIAFGREREPDWQTRIEKARCELKAYIEELTAHSDIERQDDKSSNDTQTQTIVYGKEDSEVQE